MKKGHLEIKLDRPAKEFSPGGTVTGYVEGFVPDSSSAHISLISIEARIFRESGWKCRTVLWTGSRKDLLHSSTGKKSISTGMYSLPFSIQLPDGEGYDHLCTFQSTKPAMKCIVELDAFMEDNHGSKIATDQKTISMHPSNLSTSVQSPTVLQFPVCRERIPFCCCGCFTQTPTNLAVTVSGVPRTITLTRNYNFYVQIERSEPFQHLKPSFNLFVYLVGRHKGSEFKVSEVESEYLVMLDSNAKKSQVTLHTKDRQAILAAKYPPSIPGLVDYIIRVRVATTDGKFVNYKRNVDTHVLYYPLM